MPNRRVDLVGRQFGRLTVVSRIAGDIRSHWLCRCECGEIHVAAGGNLQSGNVQSCGCLRREQKQQQMRALGGFNRPDLIGQRFGKLTVIDLAPSREGRACWSCQCDCGKRTVKKGKYLLNGDTQSCGCDQREYRSGLHRKYQELAGKYRAEYRTWRAMISRCYTKSTSHFKDYGGRGVTVCARWRYDFAAFLKDMGPRPPKHSLDRIDPFGQYEPKNCRWATAKIQANNQRRHHAASSNSGMR